MDIHMQSGATAGALSAVSWGPAIVGKIVDDRGEAAHAFAKAQATALHSLSHDSQTLEVTFDASTSTAEDLELTLKPLATQPALLEATTLGFVETLLCCRAIRNLGHTSLWILYVEPASYNRPRVPHVLHRRDFELSEEVENFSGVLGSTFMLREEIPTRAVFLVGYEGQRLEQALEQTGIRPSMCCIVFGVPAFRPGWEMDAFANNVRVIRERHLSRNVLFAGAQNPLAAYRAIYRAYQACDPGQRLLISPIGTKPHGIGAALFACDHDDVGLIYDHPKRKPKRSEKVGTWHLYHIQFGS